LKPAQKYTKPVSDLPEESFTLPSYMYTDPQVFEAEKEKIFYKTWQYIGHTSFFEKPGDYISEIICDQNIFVILGEDKKLRAFYNVCQHRAHELLPAGVGNVERGIVCPYHAWTYEKSGNLKGAPRADKRSNFSKKDYKLKSVRMEVFLDAVFVNLDPNATPLSELVPDLEIDVRKRVSFFDQLGVSKSRSDYNGLGGTIINAGWKVVVDNYVECYHCEHAHPDFSDMLCMDSYKHDIFGLWARQLCEEVRENNSAYKIEKDAPFKKSIFWFLWPNTTINILPGSEIINFSSIRPYSLEKSTFNGHSLSVSGKFNEERRLYTSNVLFKEDISLCESVQRGLKSFGYDQGPIIADSNLSGRGEHVLHLFHRLIQQTMKN